MRKFLISALLSFAFLLSAQASQLRPDFTPSPYQGHFDQAYQQFPDIPRGMLEAISWSRTRVSHRQESGMASCTGIPEYIGVMGLIRDGKGIFNANLKTVSQLSGFTEKELAADPRKNILGFAQALDATFRSLKVPASHEAWMQAEFHLSEMPLESKTQSTALFPHLSFAYQVFSLMNDLDFQQSFQCTGQKIDLQQVFGQNLPVLSAGRLRVGTDKIATPGGQTYAPPAILSPDYGPAIWDPAPACNWSSRSGTAISAVTIHTVQGSYSGAISWFKNCNSNVSAHYVIRSWDGQVTQMVLESDKAWHVGNSNPYTIGIEHEGYVDDPSWYSNAMYTASANLVKDIINGGYGIDGLKTYAGPPTSGLQVLGQNCYKIKGHQHFPNQTHVDPGQNWDWARFYKLINASPAPNTYTSCSGNFSDPGGSSGNYADQDRVTYLIQPAGATSVSLTFSAFDLESNYDFLWIYDGQDANGQLLGKFSGTTNPGTLNSNSGAFFLEFRTDCATTRPGWVASWSCATSQVACATPTSLNETAITGFGANLNWSGGSGATSYEVRLRPSLDQNWSTFSTTSTSWTAQGLPASNLIYWQVRALCGANSSSWVGGDFQTAAPANTVATSCSGDFRDSGGDAGNYTNGESWTYTISPSGANSVTLSFNSFELESNYDFLYIYDGPSTASTLLGTFSGSNSPGTITSSGNSLTLRFTSDSWTTKEGWDASWSCATTQAPSTQITTLAPWYADDFNATFTDLDNSGGGIQQRYYQVLENNGALWQGNRDNGFLYETFDGGWLNGWISTAGNAYILNNRLHQTDTTSTNTNWYIDVQQDGNHAWMYSWSGRMWQGSAATNRRFGLHIFADNPSQSQRGNSYLLWFRGDNQQVEIYETINNVLNLRTTATISLDPFVWYDFKTTYDPNSGQIKVWQDNVLIASWVDSSPLQSGGYVSLRSNEAHCDFENVRVFKSRGTTANVLIGPAATEDVRHQSPDAATFAGRIYSSVVDGNNLWSNTDLKSFYVDWTAPEAVMAMDSLGSDADTVYSLSALSGHWSASQDTNSGISAYEWALGSSPGATDIQNWVAVGDTTSASSAGLSLNHNTIYYVSVRAINFSGLYSSISSSDGQLTWSPVTGFAPAFSGPALFPNPAKDFVEISWPGRQVTKVTVFELTGKLVKEERFSGSRARLSLTGLSSGVYLIRIGTSGGTFRTARIVKE